MELMDELKRYVDYGNERLEQLDNAAREIFYSSKGTTFRDTASLKRIRKERQQLCKKLDSVVSDIDSLEEMNEKITECASILSKEKKAFVKELINKRHADVLQMFQEQEEDDVIEDNEDLDEDKDVTRTGSKKNNSKYALTAVAILAALGIAVGGTHALTTSAINRDKNNDKRSEDTADASLENNGVMYDPNTNTVEVLSFTDITDKEQVAKRANEILEDIKKSLPDYEISIETIENMINWVNGGVVENATQQECEDMLHIFLNILNKERQLRVNDNLEAIKNADKDAKGDITSNVERDLFDYSKLFIDGSNGQKLAEESFTLRKEVFSNIGSEKVNESTVKLAELLARCAYSLGGSQDLHTVEGNFGKLINLFAIFQTRAAADTNGHIIAKIDGKEYDIDYVMDALYGDCEDKNQIDLITSLMVSAQEEALNNKDVKTLTLK